MHIQCDYKCDPGQTSHKIMINTQGSKMSIQTQTNCYAMSLMCFNYHWVVTMHHLSICHNYTLSTSLRTSSFSTAELHVWVKELCSHQSSPRAQWTESVLMNLLSQKLLGCMKAQKLISNSHFTLHFSMFYKGMLTACDKWPPSLL